MPLTTALPPAVRILLKNWKLAAIAIVSLAVALALGIVGFGLFNAILLRPPYAQNPQQLVSLFTVPNPRDHQGLSYPDYVYLRDHNTVFSHVAGLPYSISKEGASLEGRAFMASINSVSDNYFETMGLKPELGRLFKLGDGDRTHKLAIVTYAEWQRLGADRNIVGKIINIDRNPWTIVGVGPRGFTGPVFGFAADIVTLAEAAGTSPERFTDHGDRWIGPIGRLKPGVTIAQARVEIESMWRQLEAAYPKDEAGLAIDVEPTRILHPDMLPDAKLISAIVLFIMALILLVACANVANLLLAIASSRSQETLIKSALGATRSRIVRDFLIESAILSFASGALGYGLAVAVLRRLSDFAMNLPAFGSIEIAQDLRVDWLVLAFAIGVCLLTALVSGLVPALHSSKPKISGALSGETVAGGTKKGILRNTIVILQVTVCTLVTIGAGLCWRSLSNLRHVDPGFSARNLVTVMLTGFTEKIKPEQRDAKYADLRRSALELPGVESASLTAGSEFAGDAAQREVRIPEDAPEPAKPSDKIRAGVNLIDENYFSTLGVKLLEGRNFTAFDVEKAPLVVIINHNMAQKFWPHESAIGKRIGIPEAKRVATVVGVAADGKYGDLDEPTHPFMYFALAQDAQDYQVLVVRTKDDPKKWVEPLAQLARRHGIDLYFEPQTLETWMNLSLFIPIVTLRCVGFLSAIALLLAAVGLYGTIYYSVSERRREIGIRVALGAMPGQLFSMIVRRASLIAAIGVISGTVLGIVATLLLQSQFFGIHAMEWYVLLPVAIGMIALAAILALAAARPWIHMNPTEAVRHT